VKLTWLNGHTTQIYKKRSQIAAERELIYLHILYINCLIRDIKVEKRPHNGGFTNANAQSLSRAWGGKLLGIAAHISSLSKLYGLHIFIGV
jgi:hypothetical protein